MRERPVGLDEAELVAALADWEIGNARLTYAPVGFGDYHWTAEDPRAGETRWFITVSDLSDHDYGELSRAMDGAHALRARGLESVVAPLATTDGATVRRLGERYALAVFPHVPGRSGEFDDRMTAAERAGVLELLARLHRTEPPADFPVAHPALAGRDTLDAALAELDRPWRGGPFAEPAREALARSAAGLRAWLAEFDAGVLRLTEAGRPAVVTHGEPHPGNLLLTEGRWRLVDWDTGGLAAPERDLWLVLRGLEGPELRDGLEQYAELSGRAPDPELLELYRLRWDLDDVRGCLEWFRAPHIRTSDTELAWRALREILERLGPGLTGSRSPEG